MISSPISFAVALSALLFCGCARSPSAASISKLAVEKSNQEAQRLYQIQPFKMENGQLRAEGQQSVWEALTSSGGHGMVAKVTFDEHGSAVSVDVQMLTHPTEKPGTNLDNLFRPNIKSERKLGIPEVMPK